MNEGRSSQMAELEELVATKLADKVEKITNEKVNAILGGQIAPGYLKRKQMVKYLNVSETTFAKIMKLGPPTVVIDGLVRYPVDEFNQWIRDNYMIWNDEYIPERNRS